MLKSKSLDILKKLNMEEFKRLDEFIRSPFFNTKKSFVKLFTELGKYYPEFSSSKMTEESVYENVFGKGKFSYSSMKNLKTN